MKKEIINVIKHRFSYSVLVFLVAISASILAETPNASGAKQFAETFFKTNRPQFARGKVARSVSLKQCYQSQSYKENPVFVFQNSELGFAVVAQRNSNFAVVGYAPEGKFNSDSIPEQLQGLLKLYEDSLRLQPDAPQKVSAGIPIGIPLLDGAGVSLNQFGHSNVGGCPSGCVATAFTQIMCYYKFPSKGIGSHCYTHKTYGQLCAEFGNTTYNWINPTAADYQLLSYQVGVAMDMNYCGSLSGSAPYNWGYEKAMHEHFRYYLNNGTSESDFIQNEIDLKRPVYIELLGKPGHALVVDGYDSDGLFHLNFGWGGQYNGYYMLNSNSTFYVGYRFGTNISAAYFLSPHPLKTNVQDSLALVAVNNAFNGATRWDLTQPVTTWQGVLVKKGRVISLNLINGSYNTFKGVIPTEIGNLTYLQTLMLSGQFDGDLPASITNLIALKKLSIYGSSGTMKAVLPSNIGNLVNLETLAIPMKCEGAIPTSIGNLVKLKTLDLNSGNLSGNIPVEIGNLINLTSLNLWKNKLTGSVPASIANLTKLTSLNLSENQLSGSLPTNLGNLAELTSLALNDNQLSGVLPETMGNCTKMTLLSLQNNQFTGEVPASFGNLTAIKSLNLANNKISALPTEIGNCSLLEDLYLNINQLSTVPEGFNKLTNLKALYLNNNKISTLPENFGQFPSLQIIDLSFNNLTEFPDELCQLTKLSGISLRKNKITQLPASLKLLASSLSSLVVDSNEIRGRIPKELLENGRLMPLLLSHNRFTFEDIPVSSALRNSVDNQKDVLLSKKVFKVAIGDTVTIDIRKIAPFTLATNQYNWVSATRNKAVSTTPNPILTVIIDDKTIATKYYCSVSNPSCPTYSFIAMGSTYTFPCLNSVKTDTLSFQLATEEELISEKNDGRFVVSTKNIPTKTIEDKTVTLVPPLHVRGTVKWQASVDGKIWYDISESMTQNDLKSNFISVSPQALVLSPKTPAFYRSSVQDVNCEPLLSDTIKVNPYGKVLYDGTVNVAIASKTIKIDSIEVTLPAGIYDKDFRLTIVKLDNQPASVADVTVFPAYDVTVSFADTFGTPLLIKLKNINKKTFVKKFIHNYKAVYLDKNTHQWISYPSSYISMQDTTMVFETNHLTVVTTGFLNKNLGYDKGYERNNITVYYQSIEEQYMLTTYDKKQTKQSWHVADIPFMVQDITEYLDQVRKKFQSSGLPIPEKFDVYIQKLEEDEGVVGITGMLTDYLTVHTYIENPNSLRSVLAHEYMHYTQGKYMSPDMGNAFWIEANGHLTDRLVWDDKVIPTSESEEYLLNGRKAENSIYTFLSNSWDYWERGFWTQKFLGELDYCYLAGTFLHYMRSYTQAEKKLDIVALLKETARLSGTNWRTYLSNYIAFSMNSNIGDEYDSFVRYILSGENKNFNILNTDVNPYSYLIKNSGAENEGTYVKRVIYNFAANKNEPQKDNIALKVPYLASKVVLLYNQTADRATMVNYKRLHTINREYKVYYGKYDIKTKTNVYVDITDSTTYNIFVEARSEKSVKENQNICFLLLVNKKNPSGTAAANFDASFELTATPVLDIEYLYTAWIAGADGNSLYVHTNSKGNKDAFMVSGVHLTRNDASIVSHVVNNYTSNRTILNDSSYLVNINFADETRSEFPTESSFPSIQISNKQMTIEYNYIASTLKLWSKTTFTNKYEKTNEEKPRILLGSIWYDETRLNLKNVNSMIISSASEYTVLSTKNSAETQAAVTKMTNSHREVRYDSTTQLPVTDETTTYVSTDYSGGDVILKMLFKMK